MFIWVEYSQYSSEDAALASQYITMGNFVNSNGLSILSDQQVKDIEKK
jgi:hypothetical protein